MQKHICDLCGYVYDNAIGDKEGNIPAGTTFDNLPDAWYCPVCGANKESFKPCN